ncbi:MAG: tRNA pseudouridine(55) synthase TruB [Thermoleophilia bacterium]|nr:tRNA pseudouridine(55) synthase TruB [Thermoleophilia bacterium]
MPEGIPPGLVLVDKPAGISSFGAISRLRPTYGKKLGHAGTLDPFATGLLLVLTGRATRLAPYLVGADKTYEATIQFGVHSTTEDPEGELTATGKQTSEQAVCAALPQLTGEINQIPPAASAIHIDGERAYRRFRRGETVTVPTRRVAVNAFTLMHFDFNSQQATVTVRCGSGTYIRSLARDLGELVETGAYLTQLRRTEVGSFSVSAASAPDLIAAAPAGALAWLPSRAAVAGLEQRTLTSDERAVVGHGGRIAVDLGGDDDVALLDVAGELIAVARVEAGVAVPKIVLVPA